MTHVKRVNGEPEGCGRTTRVTGRFWWYCGPSDIWKEVGYQPDKGISEMVFGGLMMLFRRPVVNEMIMI